MSHTTTCGITHASEEVATKWESDKQKESYCTDTNHLKTDSNSARCFKQPKKMEGINDSEELNSDKFLSEQTTAEVKNP